MGVTLRRRVTAAVALSASAALALAACGSDGGSSDSNKNKNITLEVMVFGTFGYDDLYKQYEASHPGVTIKEIGTNQGLDDENNKLSAGLAAGTAPADVVALEEGTITQYKAQAQNFVNYNDYDAASLKGNFLPWKWDEGSTSDGKVIGLGTDVGSLAMCYRTDLFAAAGLPTDRDAVSKLWPTWDDYIKTGQNFAAKTPKVKFLDSATNVYNAILMQNAGKGSGYTYFDKSDKLVIDSNADIKAAWTTTNTMITDKLSGGFASFSDDWAKAFKSGSFATIACPAWMLGVIKTDAGDAAAGKWDVAQVPGGGGNWGGSFLSVPSKGKHLKESVELAKFLTSADSQLSVFKKVNNLPSNPSIYDNSDFQAFKNEYFSNAPVGQIFGAGAKSLKPVYLGAKNQAVRNAVEDALRSVEQGKKTADAAWGEAVKNGTTAAK